MPVNCVDNFFKHLDADCVFNTSYGFINSLSTSLIAVL